MLREIESFTFILEDRGYYRFYTLKICCDYKRSSLDGRGMSVKVLHQSNNSRDISEEGKCWGG